MEKSEVITTNAPKSPQSSEVSGPLSSNENSKNVKVKTSMRWWVLLASYGTILALSGIAVFWDRGINPAARIDAQIENLLRDQETKQIIEKILIAESESYESKRETAMQAFNVTLGAALGFLSASAATIKANGSDKEMG